MSNVSISNCLSKGFRPPAGSRLPILIPMLVFVLAISPFIISLYMRSFELNEFLNHVLTISIAYQQYSALTHFILTLIYNIITQPLIVGTLLCAIRSQQDNENLKPTFFTAFTIYFYTLKLLPVILFTTILTTSIVALINNLPALHHFAEHHYYFSYIGAASWSILGFILIFTQIFIVDKHCSTLMALKQTCKKMLKLNVFICFAFSFLLYYIYVFFTLFLIPIGMHLISLQSHSMNYFIAGATAVAFSICWLLHALPGLCHIPAYIYLKQTSQPDISTDKDNLNTGNTLKEPQETKKTEDKLATSINNESAQAT